jgi:OOP family OmpA-OmpF porin
MPSSRLALATALGALVVVASSHAARAQAQAQAGYALERFQPSPAGAGWLVMDALDMTGGLGGAMSATVDYAHDPLDVSQGGQQVAVVSRQSMLDLGAAVTYAWWRLSIDFETPIVIEGHDGTVGGTTFMAPDVTLTSSPDVQADTRIGFDARFIGDATGPFRVGASAQLFVPSGHQDQYETDGSVRALLRGLVAGDVGRFTYAGELGVHIRTLDESPVPDSPRGSELWFGAAAGARTHITPCADLVIGPEVFGATAFRDLFSTGATSLEALLSARAEGIARSGRQLRVKLGVGAGLATSLGTPDWRVIAGIEVFDRGISKSKPTKAP